LPKLNKKFNSRLKEEMNEMFRRDGDMQKTKDFRQVGQSEAESLWKKFDNLTINDDNVPAWVLNMLVEASKNKIKEEIIPEAPKEQFDAEELS